MAEDTAVLAPETTAPEVEAPPSDYLTPEIDVDTDQQESAAGTPETDDAAPEAFSKEDVDKAVAEALSRAQEEANRQAEESATVARITEGQRAVQAARGRLSAKHSKALSNTINYVKSEIEKGNELRWNQDDVAASIMQQVVDDTYTDQFWRTHELDDAIIAKEFAGLDTPADVERSLRLAIANHDGQSARIAQTQKIIALAKKQARAEFTDEVRTEIEREEAEKRKTDSVRTAAQTRQERTRPSTPKGDGSPAVRNPSDIIADPNSSLVEKRKAYRDAHGIDPPF